MLTKFIDGVKGLVFPDNCFLCRAFLNSGHQRQLCPACLQSLKTNAPPFCALCSRHLSQYSDDGLCASCRGSQRYYDRVWGTCLYDEPMRKLLHSFKYTGKTALRKTFLSLMASFIDTYHVPLEQFDMVCPVALHPVRLRERGFNQSELLSEALCRHYRLLHRPQLLVRQQPTGTQALLDQKQRWTNLKDAFKINPSEIPADKAVLVVDDLVTTGATADAAAAALKGAGAAYVGVLALAITDPV